MGEQWGRAHHMVAAHPDEFVARMDEAGVQAVCVPSLKQAYYRKRAMAVDIEHEHIATLAQDHPGRIVGMAGIDPMSGLEGVRRLERAVRDYGFRGAHVHPFGFGIPLNEREWWPFYTKAAELGSRSSSRPATRRSSCRAPAASRSCSTTSRSGSPSCTWWARTPAGPGSRS